WAAPALARRAPPPAPPPPPPPHPLRPSAPRRASHAAALVADEDDPEPDHDVADRDHLVDRVRHAQPVAEEREQIVVALGSVLRRPLDGFLDGPARAGRPLVVGGGHPLVETEAGAVE